MPIPPETEIRDYLADHLGLIESGLTLIAKEHPLANPIGAGGSIDILARDALGLFVVIEIKKSDKTARETLHELHKYVGLLKLQYGLPSHNLRCLVVSTHWHELLLPFSEFCNAVDFHCEGYILDLSSGITHMQFHRQTLLPSASEVTLCRYHDIYLFLDDASLNAFTVNIETVLILQPQLL